MLTLLVGIRDPRIQRGGDAHTVRAFIDISPKNFGVSRVSPDSLGEEPGGYFLQQQGILASLPIEETTMNSLLV